MIYLIQRRSRAPWRAAPMLELHCDCGRVTFFCSWSELPRFCPRCGADIPTRDRLEVRHD